MSNHQYKDSLLRHIMNRPETAASLYRALYDDDTVTAADIELVTLDNILMDRLKNDLSFVARNHRVCLLEHQSTANDNMPLRFALYLSELLRHLLPNNQAMYHRKLIKIPAPGFVVLQQGNPHAPDHDVKLLSEAFMEPSDALELKVDVFNIDYRPGRAILEKCPPLRDYSFFIGKVDEYLAQGINRDSAIKKALLFCKDNGVLWSYIQDTYEEVISMVTLRYDEAEAHEAYREEGRLEGRQEGRVEGILSIIKNMVHLNTPYSDSARLTGTSLDDVIKIANDAKLAY